MKLPPESVLIVDDFLPDPVAVRASALRSDFRTVIHDGFPYAGIGTDVTPHLPARLSDLFGPLVLHMNFYRLNAAGDIPTSWIHADRGCGTWAAICYLNPPEQVAGGTALWRHRGTGLTGMPDADQLAALSLTADELAAQLRADANDAVKWDLLDIISMRTNRLAVYPTRRFHSRYPFHAYGHDGATSRLVWVAFFDGGAA